MENLKKLKKFIFKRNESLLEDNARWGKLRLNQDITGWNALPTGTKILFWDPMGVDFKKADQHVEDQGVWVIGQVKERVTRRDKVIKTAMVQNFYNLNKLEILVSFSSEPYTYTERCVNMPPGGLWGLLDVDDVFDLGEITHAEKENGLIEMDIDIEGLEVSDVKDKEEDDARLVSEGSMFGGNLSRTPTKQSLNNTETALKRITDFGDETQANAIETVAIDVENVKDRDGEVKTKGSPLDTIFDSSTNNGNGGQVTTSQTSAVVHWSDQPLKDKESVIVSEKGKNTANNITPLLSMNYKALESATETDSCLTISSQRSDWESLDLEISNVMTGLNITENVSAWVRVLDDSAGGLGSKEVIKNKERIKVLKTINECATKGFVGSFKLGLLPVADRVAKGGNAGGGKFNVEPASLQYLSDHPLRPSNYARRLKTTLINLNKACDMLTRMENDVDSQGASMLSHPLDVWLGQDDLRAGELLSDDFSTLENARDLVLHTLTELEKERTEKKSRKLVINEVKAASDKIHSRIDSIESVNVSKGVCSITSKPKDTCSTEISGAPETASGSGGEKNSSDSLKQYKEFLDSTVEQKDQFLFLTNPSEWERRIAKSSDNRIHRAIHAASTSEIDPLWISGRAIVEFSDLRSKYQQLMMAKTMLVEFMDTSVQDNDHLISILKNMEERRDKIREKSLIACGNVQTSCSNAVHINSTFINEIRKECKKVMEAIDNMKSVIEKLRRKKDDRGVTLNKSNITLDQAASQMKQFDGLSNATLLEFQHHNTELLKKCGIDRELWGSMFLTKVQSPAVDRLSIEVKDSKDLNKMLQELDHYYGQSHLVADRLINIHVSHGKIHNPADNPGSALILLRKHLETVASTERFLKLKDDKNVKYELVTSNNVRSLLSLLPTDVKLTHPELTRVSNSPEERLVQYNLLVKWMKQTHTNLQFIDSERRDSTVDHCLVTNEKKTGSNDNTSTDDMVPAKEVMSLLRRLVEDKSQTNDNKDKQKIQITFCRFCELIKTSDYSSSKEMFPGFPEDFKDIHRIIIINEKPALFASGCLKFLHLTLDQRNAILENAFKRVCRVCLRFPKDWNLNKTECKDGKHLPRPTPGNFNGLCANTSCSKAWLICVEHQEENKRHKHKITSELWYKKTMRQLNLQDIVNEDVVLIQTPAEFENFNDTSMIHAYVSSAFQLEGPLEFPQLTDNIEEFRRKQAGKLVDNRENNESLFCYVTLLDHFGKEFRGIYDSACTTVCVIPRVVNEGNFNMVMTGNEKNVKGIGGVQRSKSALIDLPLANKGIVTVKASILSYLPVMEYKNVKSRVQQAVEVLDEESLTYQMLRKTFGLDHIDQTYGGPIEILLGTPVHSYFPEKVITFSSGAILFKHKFAVPDRCMFTIGGSWNNDKKLAVEHVHAFVAHVKQCNIALERMGDLHCDGDLKDKILRSEHELSAMFMTTADEDITEHAYMSTFKAQANMEAIKLGTEPVFPVLASAQSPR